MEDFVTFELAVKLKEKGFREKCFATYTPYGGIIKFNEISTDKVAPCDLNIKDFKKCYNHYKDNSIDAPTISQVLTWLRKEKKMHINIGIYPNGWKFYCCSCEKYNNGKFGDYDIYEPLGLYNSYEAAAIAGIEYCLENLI